MLNIDENLKTIYKNDVIPLASELSHKTLTLYFPDLDLTITNDKIVSESFSLTESICSTEDLTLGSCEAAQLKITVADLIQDLSGYEFVVTQTVNDTYTMPLGTYKVESCKKQNDRWFREIIAYDSMKKTDVDVSEWYNGLTFPISVKDMRESLLIYLGIVYESQDLTNDDVMLEKTIEPSYLLGRDVLKCLCELTGGFGHITRENKFKVVQLSGMGLYPSETLYPAEDLFPAESGEFLTAGYKNIDYEEYIVDAITGIQIRQDDEDEGVVVGSGDNTYTITGNFLLYGKSAEELETIAHNILLQVANKFYRPHTTQLIGLPYMEVGDTITIITSNDAIETFIFQRTLTGIQALQDEYTATGSQKRTNKASLSTQVEQLKGKTLRIQKDVEGVMLSVSDIERNVSSQLSAMADEIDLKVSKNGVISAINVSPEAVKIQAAHIALEGLVTVNGNTKINTNGTIEAVNGKFSGVLTSSEFIGGVVRSSNYSSGESGMMIDLTNCIIDTPNLYVDSAGKIHATDGEFSGDITGSAITGSTFSRVVNWSGTQVTLTTIDDNGFYQWISDTSGARFQVGSLNHYNSILADQNGVTIGNAYNGHSVVVGQYGVFIDNQTPITSANISSQNVYSLGGTVYVSANGNLRPFSSGLSSCGTSEGKWSSVWAVNGTIQTSDERKKTNIKPLEEDERFLRFAKMIVPYIYQMIDGTSGRYHTGFIGQRIEDAMIECRISSTEFAGLIKAPVYAEKLKDVNGNELNEYDTTSEIIDYTYHLRYEEFIPLIFLWLRSL